METMAQKRRGKRVAKSKAVFEGVGIPGVFRPQPPSPRRKKQSKAKTKTPSPAATSSTMGEGGPVRGTTDHSVGVTFNEAEPIAPRNIAATGAFAGGAFQTDASETAVTADTTAVTADTASATVAKLEAVLEPVVVSAVGTARVSRNTLSERPVEIRDAARALSREFAAQVEELKGSRPNEPDRLAKHDDLVGFLERMAAGLSKLADALDQAMNEAAEGKLEPAFLGRTAEVVRQLQLGAIEWLEKNRTTVFEVPFRIGLFGLGLAFVHALGVDGHLVTTLIAGLALKQAPKKSKRSSKHRKRARTVT
jgi:hypothetical protein